MSSQSLTVLPGRPLAGRFRPPGDKSITHRAILLGLLAHGESVIEVGNPGADCESTLGCAEALGAEVTRESPARVRIHGRGSVLRSPTAPLECGNSGTTLRLLAGVLAAQLFESVLQGDASLSRRPVARVIEPLRLMGATLSARDGDRYPPLVIRGAELRPIEYHLPIASAQVASCVLLAGCLTTGLTAVEIPGAARDHTERMLEAAGAELEVTPRANGGRRVALRGPVRLEGMRIPIPGDFSAAAFFLAAAAATPGATVTAESVNLNPTRTGLLDALEAMGAKIERTSVRNQCREPVGDVTVIGPEQLAAIEIPATWVPRMVDEIPAWVIAASAARGVSRLTGAGELRVKESDRLATLAGNLVRLGIAARDHPEGLEIQGGTLRGGSVSAAGDHRIAMTFAVLGTRADTPVTVDDVSSIATSYPGFFDALRALGGQIETVKPERAAS